MFTEFYFTSLNRQFTYLSRIFTGKEFNFYYLLAILLFIKFLLFFNKYFTGKNKKNTGTFINCLNSKVIENQFKSNSKIPAFFG